MHTKKIKLLHLIYLYICIISSGFSLPLLLEEIRNTNTAYEVFQSHDSIPAGRTFTVGTDIKRGRFPISGKIITFSIYGTNGFFTATSKYQSTLRTDKNGHAEAEITAKKKGRIFVIVNFIRHSSETLEHAEIISVDVTEKINIHGYTILAGLLFLFFSAGIIYTFAEIRAGSTPANISAHNFFTLAARGLFGQSPLRLSMLLSDYNVLCWFFSRIKLFRTPESILLTSRQKTLTALMQVLLCGGFVFSYYFKSPLPIIVSLILITFLSVNASAIPVLIGISGLICSQLLIPEYAEELTALIALKPVLFGLSALFISVCCVHSFPLALLLSLTIHGLGILPLPVYAAYAAVSAGLALTAVFFSLRETSTNSNRTGT